MRKSSLLLALLLGMSLPTTLTLLGSPETAIAFPRLPKNPIPTELSLPTDLSFLAGRWLADDLDINLALVDDALHLYGSDVLTGADIHLTDGRLGGTPQNLLYIWEQDGGSRYQVAWQPDDPDEMRFQVFGPNGGRLLNTLMNLDD